MNKFHTLSVEESLIEVKSGESGLKNEEAKSRLESKGKNVINFDKKKSLALMFFKQFIDVIILVLIVAGTLSFVFAIMHDSATDIIDGIVIFAIVILNAVFGFVQEAKADKSLQKLKKLTIREAKVIRDGEIIKIKSEDLVVGDIVFIEAGDIIPADLRVIDSIHLRCDESSLTGEAAAVEKITGKLAENVSLADRKNMLYSGSNVVNGRGYGLVVAVGLDTEMGKIALLLKSQKSTLTPIQKNLKSLGIFLSIIVLVIAVIIFVLEILKPNTDYVFALMTAVAVAVAAIPESMPAIVTVIMSVGVTRLVKKKAIVKKLNAVETLGCCEIICSDKTGTLTENKMTVSAIYDNEKTIYDFVKLSETASLSLQYLLKVMALCNTCAVQKSIAIGDPTEVALCDLAFKVGYEKDNLSKKFKLVDEYAFDSKRKLMTTVHQDENGKQISLTKGGLDEVLNCCKDLIIDGKVFSLTDERKDIILSQAKKMTRKALRVLGFAFGNGEKVENNLTFVGFAGMIDRPRPEAFEAVKSCFRAGMVPIMITGDHKDTAFEIAKQLGIAKKSNEVLLGAELDKLTEKQYLKIIHRIKVYARVTPENKVRIVQAYRKLGKVVAMTGDGVNDAPSIKSANIGIGMGITGTDISKDAADIIITDDNFATIIVAIEEGRRIYKNIEKTIKFLLASNGAEVLAIFLVTLIFPNFIFLLPIHILFINLITDGVPSIALSFEPADKDIMFEGPRKINRSLILSGNGIYILFFSLVQCAIIIGAYLFGLYLFGSFVAATMAFYSFNIVQVFYIISARTEDSIFKNSLFNNKWIVFSLILQVIIILIVAITPLGSVLRLASVNYLGWLICIGLCFLMLPISEIYKVISKKIKKNVKKD